MDSLSERYTKVTQGTLGMLSLFSLWDLSVISLWLILREEFSWKKSFNKARTIFSLSAPRKGHHHSLRAYLSLPLHAFLCSRELVASISPTGTHRRRFVLHAPLQNVLERGVHGKWWRYSQKKERRKKERKMMNEIRVLSSVYQRGRWSSKDEKDLLNKITKPHLKQNSPSLSVHCVEALMQEIFLALKSFPQKFRVCFTSRQKSWTLKPLQQLPGSFLTTSTDLW